jgi:hypothetical protein
VRNQRLIVRDVAAERACEREREREREKERERESIITLKRRNTRAAARGAARVLSLARNPSRTEGMGNAMQLAGLRAPPCIYCTLFHSVSIATLYKLVLGPAVINTHVTNLCVCTDLTGAPCARRVS